MAYREEGHAEHHAHDVKYVVIFIALCGFTGLSIVFDLLEYASPAIKNILVMAVAVAKALCVMLFFMHLKFEGAWKYLLLAPTVILGIGLPIALMPDIAVPYYQRDVPQIDDYDEAMSHHANHTEGEHAGGGEHHAEGADDHDHADESGADHNTDSTTSEKPAEDQ